MENKSFLQKTWHEFTSIFLSGLFTLLPVGLTFALFSFTFKLIKNWSSPIHAVLPQAIKNVPNSSILVVLFTILVVGAILKYFLLHPLVDFIERHLFGNIPLVRQVYFGIKQLVQTLSPDEEGKPDSVQLVVLVEFPRPGIYCIGLVTGIASPQMIPSMIGSEQGSIYYNVFIPTTPNPTTGFFFVVSEKDCKITTLTRKEAMALVISGGIIQPERFTQK
jgi:uncharacterized membrane protein